MLESHAAQQEKHKKVFFVLKFQVWLFLKKAKLFPAYDESNVYVSCVGDSTSLLLAIADDSPCNTSQIRSIEHR